MSQVLSPEGAIHVRSGRYAQRERPAASIPSRIRARRSADHAEELRRLAALPVIALFIGLRAT